MTESLSSPAVPSPENPQALPEEIAPHLTRSWLQDRQIVVFTLTAASRATVDAWVDCVKETMLNWPSDRVYLAIHDMTSDKTSLTPYARKRAEDLLPLSTGRPGYAALLLPKTFVAQVIRLFLRTQSHQGNDNQIFFTYEDALAWLNERAHAVQNNATLQRN